MAQQQVNPIALQGFSLPIGQNGFFRLSGQGASSGQAAQANAGPQSWTLGAASVGLAQRQQNLPETQGRTIQLEEVTQLAANNRQISVTAREASGIMPAPAPLTLPAWAAPT
ncbi:hypothetical protein [Pseudomonas antarctica]|uniref:hypothetical protein n=1 Tax=Pseudomonas antarctica TaxID=219572 RepID=UPI00387AB177